jgi:UDP-glucuronate 4-epimerase
MATKDLFKKAIFIVLLAVGAKLIHEYDVLDKCREQALHSIEAIEDYFGLTTKIPLTIFENEHLLFKYSFVLVSGGSGYLGFHASRELVNRGIKYISAIDSTDNYESTVYANQRIEQLAGVDSIKVVNKTVCDYEALSQLYRIYKFSHILHFSHHQNDDRLNSDEFSDCFENVLRLVASLKEKKENLPHVTYTSSPSNQNEILARSYFDTYGIVSVGLQMSQVYGSWGNMNSMPFSYVESIINKKPIQMSNDQEENYIHIKDLIEGVFEAMQYKSSEPEMFTLANHKSTKLKKVVEILEKRLNRKGKIEFTSKNTQKSQPQFSIQKTQKLLNFKPKIELTDGLNQVLDWYLIHKNYTTFCASDCALENDLPCLKSGYDDVMGLSREMSEHCDLVVYTVAIEKWLKYLHMPKVELLDKNHNSCYFAFVSGSSAFYKEQGKNQSQWRSIPIHYSGYPITQRKFSRIPKMAPSLFFHKNVQYAIYVDAKMAFLGDPRELVKEIELPNDKKALMAGFRHLRNDSLYDYFEFVSKANKSQLSQTLQEEYKRHQEIGRENNLTYTQLMETSYLIHNLQSANAKIFRCKWLREYLNGADRDQVILPYIIDSMALEIGVRLSEPTELCPVALNQETKETEFIRILPRSSHWEKINGTIKEHLYTTLLEDPLYN